MYAYKSICIGIELLKYGVGMTIVASYIKTYELLRDIRCIKLK